MHKRDFVSKRGVWGLNNIHACLKVLGASIQQLRATKEFGLESYSSQPATEETTHAWVRVLMSRQHPCLVSTPFWKLSREKRL